MTEKMTLDEFEALLDDFGGDIGVWPPSKQVSAQVVAMSNEGKLLLAADSALDEMVASAHAIGPECASDNNSDAFLERLMDIPVYHHQETSVKKLGSLINWFKTVFDDSTDWLSPAALVSQGATFAAVLGVGVIVGMSVPQGEYDEIDISEAWFVVENDYELDEQ